MLNVIVSSKTDEWECSVSHLGNWFSETSIELNCERYKDEIDQCCHFLDKCYEEQRGRKLCDDHLCDCLDEAATKDDACKSIHIPAFCDAARSFGQNAYEEAARVNEKLGIEVKVVKVEDESTSSAAVISKSVVLLTIASFSWMIITFF
uniref:Uncharacterized protein n=1 Tax=Plectus sambesii TaxID=2011161 RepID=A0A914W9I5_9BILA